MSATSLKHVALLHWGDVIEDFLSEINLTLQQFREEMTGGWMFGFIEALRSAGVRTTLICVSAQVERIECWRHTPTGADICVLPASRAWRWLRQVIERRPADGGLFARQITRILKDALPYLATPVSLLRSELRRRACDAVLCQEYEHARFDLSVLAGILGGVPVFATFQGGDTRFSRFEPFFRALSVRKSAGLIIGSSRERDRVEKRYRASVQKIATICNPLDLSLWFPEDRLASRRALHLPEDAVLLIWHGRIDLRRKGLDILIDAWQQMIRQRPAANALLVIVGDGPDSDSLRKLIAGSNTPGVIWRNQYVLDRSEMRRYLSAADIYAFSSRHEGFPVAPLEAMACGLPVVATDCIGIRDILSHPYDGGIVVPLEDSSALAHALGALVDDAELRLRLGQQARKRVEQNFSLPVVGEKLKNFLNLPRLTPRGAER
ncbi:MAG: glycosyl transferase family 1 [Bryobacterales bacterium]|nr:glycosyl transferase family 1 [Bryobacterales bacterium]